MSSHSKPQIKWAIDKRKVSDLREYAINARSLSKHDSKHLRESISKFGLCEPIVINTDNIVIGGHQRLRTLKKMGKKEVDVSIPDRTLSEKEVEELNIRLNRNVGEWDWDILGNCWEATDLIDWGFFPEQLHLEEVSSDNGEKEQSNSNGCKMTIHFKSEDQLQDAENKISVIVDEYEGCYYKVKLNG